MALREILRWPDPRLSQPCAPVERITPRHRKLAADMLDTMYAAPGRGLAAPQVGVMERLFVMDVTWKEGTRAPGVFINPRITWADEETSLVGEGCLSIPGVTAEVERPVAIRLAWRDLDGAAHEELLTGAAARCAQHEADHLDGLVHFDRISAEQRAVLEGAYT